jgi:broad specificity phosphatase PhoE
MEHGVQVLLVRHGQSEWNAARRWQGQADPPLTALGRFQARAAAESVGAMDAIVASDLRRAAETAAILSGNLGVGPVLADGRWRERDVGPWTGLTRAEIDDRWPGWLEDHRRPEGFEHDDDVVARALPALLELGSRDTGRSVLVVTHGGVIRSIERHLGLEAEWIDNLDALPLTVSPTKVTGGGRLRLIDHVAVAAEHDEQEAG